MGKLTDVERAYLWRRRRGLGQAEMAKRARIHPDTLGSRERGQGGRIGGIPGGAKTLKPEPWELCVVERRRNRETQAEIARKMGVTRHVVMAWERGEWSWERLAKYWGIRY